MFERLVLFTSCEISVHLDGLCVTYIGILLYTEMHLGYSVGVWQYSMAFRDRWG